jgi:hypothetical protein
VGSAFTLYVPLRYAGPASGGVLPEKLLPAAAQVLAAQASEPAPEPIPDDRETIVTGDPVLLVVEDDPNYARVLVDLARDSGFKVVVAMRGADVMDLALQFRPTAISLDVFLPDMLGWTLLTQLKQDPATRHIPVQMLTLDEDRQHGLASGAFSFMRKPTRTQDLSEAIHRIRDFAAPRRKRLLVVEDNEAERISVEALLGHEDIEIATASTGQEALERLRSERHDCMVLDLRLPDVSGFDILETIRDDADLKDLPVVVFTGKELTADEDSRLHTMARSVVVKGVESPERLLDETALFLHRVVTDLPPEKQQMLHRLHASDEDLRGKSVLIVDDDVRNIFALSSLLERRGMRVITASTGKEAIEILARVPEVAIVLMDIMMPEMDGYETTRAIRQNASLRRMPIIALTAKAMKGDREKCLEAGASDYLAKPVDTTELLSALRMWLHR